MSPRISAGDTFEEWNSFTEVQSSLEAAHGKDGADH
jgi:hypothetical protein